MRFDYLHAPPSALVRRILETRIPERFHTALFALCGSVAILAGSWAIESYRLHQANAVEQACELRYIDTQRQLEQANLYYDRVKALVELDRSIRVIAASGDADALTLADIANQLPPRAWLTGISHDGTGLALEGRAKNLSVVGSVLRGLMKAKHLRRPTLESAMLDKGANGESEMKYTIHVDADAK